MKKFLLSLTAEAPAPRDLKREQDVSLVGLRQKYPGSASGENLSRVVGLAARLVQAAPRLEGRSHSPCWPAADTAGGTERLSEDLDPGQPRKAARVINPFLQFAPPR